MTAQSADRQTQFVKVSSGPQWHRLIIENKKKKKKNKGKEKKKERKRLSKSANIYIIYYCFFFHVQEKNPTSQLFG